MTQQHPITPPPELVEQWVADANEYVEQEEYAFANRAAQWGADQELEACCLWLNGGSKIDYDTAALLRAARRPKPPSLKEQALALINHDPANQPFLSDKGIDTIRRALEQLDD
jgi:hypothetical protein